MTLISFIQAQEILKAVEEEKQKIRILLNLGLNPTTIDLNYKFKEARFSGIKVSFTALEEIAHDESLCYYIEKGKSPQKLKLLSAETNQFYKLVPSRDAPTIEILGVRMHRTDITPWQDTLNKISSISPLKGRVLDTCCCLGYTAITAAKEDAVTQVFTFEKDSNVLELSDYNPWSKELYLNRKIKLTVGDVYLGIEMFSKEFFDSVIHDPSKYFLSPELYSLDFYKKLFRVMKPNGKLYHSTDADDQIEIVRDVIKPLKEAGFKQVTFKPDIFGVTAKK